MKKAMITAAAAMTMSMAFGAGGAEAQPKIYAYTGAGNYCLAGMQPITLNGVICCGKPNQSMSYQQVMAHLVKRKVHRTYKRRTVRSAVVCPEGEKGCYTR